MHDMYVAHKLWINLKEECLTCPLIKSQNNKIIDEALRELLLTESPPNTPQVKLVNEEGWTKTIMVRWSTLKISALYAHFGKFAFFTFETHDDVYVSTDFFLCLQNLMQ